MNKDTVFTYACNKKSVVFSFDSPFWITDISGVSGNDVSITGVQSAGQTGSTITDQAVQPRTITVDGVFMSNPELNRRALLDCVLPGACGRLTIKQNGESWYIDGAPAKTPDITDGEALQFFQFVLYCPYPYWRSTENSAQQVAGLTKLFQFPCTLAGIWYLSEYTDGFFTVIQNSGNLPIEFDVIFTAKTQVTDPQIYLVEQRRFIKLNKVLAAGEQITVSTVYGRKGVVLQLADGTESNGFRYLDIDSDLNLRLLPGANTIRFDAANNREGLDVKIIAPKGVIAGV